MIGFTDIDGEFVPLHAIERVTMRANKHKVMMAVVQTLNGERLESIGSTWESFLRKPIQLLPCVPGTKLLHFDPSPPEGCDRVFTSPLIAWALCVDGEIRPVTPGGVNDGSGEPRWGNFVVMPDGSVEAVGEWGSYTGFANVAMFIEKMTADYGPAPAASTAEDGAA